MNHVTRFIRLPLALYILVMGTGVNAAPTASPSDNSSLRSTHTSMVVPLDVAVVAGLVPFAPVSRPAEITEFFLNIGLKSVPPALYVPNNKTFSPNSSDSCLREFSIPNAVSDPGAYAYTDWFGFWSIQNIATGASDWGDLADVDSRNRVQAPRVKHANTSVNLSVGFSADRDSTAGGVALPEGVHTVTWRADATISPFWDVNLPLFLMVFDAAAEARYGAAASKKVAKASAKSAERLKRKLAKKAAQNLAESAGFRAAEYFLGGFTDAKVSATNIGQQTFTVWDIHTPNITATASDLEFEALTFGGTSFARVEEEVMATISYWDDCGRAVTLEADIPTFLPIGTTSVTWTVSDAGPYRSDIAPTSSMTQTYTVVDTQPPLLVAPQGFAEYAMADRNINDADFSLGIAQVIDLADPLPEVTHDAPTILERDRRYLITWNATDASGNSTTPEDDDAERYTQLVTIKTPGTNTAPVAEAGSAAAITGEKQTITLTGIDLDFIDGRFDPLDFKIAEHPEDGEFIAPLRPYFIEDYRVTPVGETGRMQDNVEIFTSPLLHLAEAFQQEASNARGTFLNDQICNAEPDTFNEQTFGNEIPVNFVYQPSYVHVDDDGFSYIRDHFFKCGEDLPLSILQAGDLDPIPRISKWSEDGELVAMHELYPLTGETYPDDTLNTTNAWPVSTFSYDATGRLWTFTSPIFSTFSQSLRTLSLDNNLETIAYHGGAGYSETDVINGNTFIGTVSDPSRNILYELHSSGVRVYPISDDYQVQVSPPHGPEKINRDCEHFTCVDGVDMAVDSDGHLYVLDRFGDRIHKFDRPTLDAEGNWEVGEYIGWLGSCTTNLTDENGIPYLACDETEGRSYGYLCTDEKCTRAASTSGEGAGQFDSPQSIEMGPDDLLYVADTENSRVQRFGQDGTFAGQAKSSGTGINEGADPGFVLGNMGKPEYLAVNSSAFYVMEPASEFGDHFLHVYKTLPFYDMTDDSAKVDYVSHVNFQGEDSFSFLVDDGIDKSEPAEIDVTVSRAFRPPEDLRAICYTNALFETATDCSVNEDGTLYLRLRAQELDGFIGNGGLDTHTNTLLSDVTNGVLTLMDTQVSHVDYRYQPNADYYGEDGFSFMVNDGVDDAAAPGLVSITVVPQRDNTVIEVPESVLVARGFSKSISFPFTDIDADTFPQPQATHISWGDGTLASLAEGWEDIGLVDEHGDPIDPQINTTPGNGYFVAAHTYDTAVDGIRLCMVSEGDSEPSCEQSVDVEVIEATQVGASLWSESIVEVGVAVDFDIFVLNKTPEFWNGISADNVTVDVAFPEGLSVVSADSRCGLSDGIYTCALGDMSVFDEGADDDNAETLHFSVMLTPETAAEDPNFLVDIEITDDGPRLDTSTKLPLALTAADNDGDDTLNYFDDFPEDARYSTDSDNDFMADSWELAYGLDPENASDAALDSDGDGATNLQEFNNDSAPFLAEPFYAVQQLALDSGEEDRLGFKLAAGDYNGDGFNDVVATAPTYGDQGAFLLALGSATGFIQQDLEIPLAGITNFGRSVAMGDIDDDGFDDIAVGSDGAVHIYFGAENGDSGRSTRFDSPDTTHASFGTAVAIADIDEDGLKDLLVSSPLDDVFTTDNGVVYVYRAVDEYWVSGSLLAPYVVTTPSGNHRIGDSIHVSDIDGDGLNDLLIGAAFDGSGWVDAHLGSAFDWSSGQKDLPDFSLPGVGASDRFGYSLAGGHDIDGDATPDLIVGAYRNAGMGGVFTYNSLDEYWLETFASASSQINGEETSEQFGVSTAVLPPMAFRENEPVIVAGANRWGEDEGRIALYFSADLETAVLTDTGDEHDMLGYAVVSAGDVNGDGFADLVVGAPDISLGDHTGDGGYIKLYLGSEALEQADDDGDQVADALDNCVSDANTDQADADGDGEGNVCDATPGVTPTPTATPTVTPSPTPTATPSDSGGGGGGGALHWFLLMLLVPLLWRRHYRGV
ncbi:MAG: FG-GAP-like repeat-containing protein [Agarilytica sp.]